ncbi:unnamed protein product [Rotaria sp. Silwood1]|nr:unnamed protein product [Rotaria sp. Silwood1]
MNDASNMDFVDQSENIPETTTDKREISPYQHWIDQLEKLKTLPKTNSRLKKEIWSQFLPLWCEILQISPSDAELCYQECASILTGLFKGVNYHFLRSDIQITRESCFTCISQLNQPNIRYYLELTTEQQNLPNNQIYYKHVFYLLWIAGNLISYLSFAKIDDQQFIESHTELYSILIEHIEQSMPEHCQTATETEYDLGHINVRILSLMWNTTDRTILVPILLKCDLARKVVGWLSQSAKLTDSGRRPLISIVYNLARHDDGADELNKYGAIDMIKKFKNIKPEKKDTRIFTASMALALLSTPEELKQNKKGMNTVLDQLLQLVIDAAKSDRYRHDGFHISEPLGIRMTGMKYVRFREPFGSQQNKATELLNTILVSLSPTQTLPNEHVSVQPTPLSNHKISSPPPSLSPSTHQPPLTLNTVTTQPTTVTTFRPLNQWTSTSGDIQAWFAHHRLSIELRDLFDFQSGDEMLDYAQLLISDRENQMKIYTRIFSKKYNGSDMPPHEFNRFAKALENLLRDNPSPRIKTNPSNSTKSSTCIIL